MTEATTGGALVASVATEGGAMTVAQLKANRQLMKDAMRDLMEEGIHYGTVPGTKKPTLLKPGAELLFVLFRVAGEPIVEDLSTDDCIRYRVKMKAEHIPTGQVIAWGVGECSTDEEKYKWRGTYNQREWEATPDDRRRMKYGWDKDERREYEQKQIRTNPADAANTILKMAEKRAKSDAALAFSAASDVFAQDLDDIADWLKEKEAGEADKPPPAGKASSTKAPQPKTSSTPQTGKINEGQLGVLKQSIDASGIGETEFMKKFELERLEDLPFARLNEAITYCKKMQGGGAQ